MPTCALLACLVLAVCLAASAQPAAAASYVVAPTGSDSAHGGPGAPFRTISRGAAVARAGDTVTVRAGRYAETVAITGQNRGVEFRAAAGERPVVDGEGVRAHGFSNNGADDLTIAGFEVTGQTTTGIFVRGQRNRIEGNAVHHVGQRGGSETNGIRVAWGHQSRIAGNTVHHVGPGWQSIGIWLLETRDAHVTGNTVYLVRKEGIRDWKGLDNTIAGNRAFLNWVGLSLNTSTGSTLTGNYASDNVEGIAVKHQSYSTVLRHWGLDTAHWSRITGNTVYRSTEASLWLAQSDEPMDYVSVRDNVFSGAGTAFLRDRPDLRGPNVVVDANAYSDLGGRPSWLYKAGWDSSPGLNSWDEVRDRVGWERTAAGRAASLAAPAGVPAPGVEWTPFPMTPIDSSSKGTYYTRAHLDKTADNNQNSYWMTATSQNEYVVFDFGRQRTFNHLILTVYSHEDRRNVRGYRFEVSGDGRQLGHRGGGDEPRLRRLGIPLRAGPAAHGPLPALHGGRQLLRLVRAAHRVWRRVRDQRRQGGDAGLPTGSHVARACRPGPSPRRAQLRRGPHARPLGSRAA